MSKLRIKPLFQVRHYKPNNNSHKWHKRVDDHGLQDLEANFCVPQRDVVSERSIEVLQILRVMLFEVCVNNQKQESGVEKLSKKDNFSNECFLGTLGLNANPFD